MAADGGLCCRRDRLLSPIDAIRAEKVEGWRRRVRVVDLIGVEEEAEPFPAVRRDPAEPVCERRVHLAARVPEVGPLALAIVRKTALEARAADQHAVLGDRGGLVAVCTENLRQRRRVPRETINRAEDTMNRRVQSREHARMRGG